MLKKFIKKIVFFINRNPLGKRLYEKEILKRSQIASANILPLSKHINMFSPYTNEIHPSNDWYGHAKILKKFLNLPENYQFKFILEHGVYLTKQVDSLDIESNLPTIITYCDYRQRILKKYRDHVFSIGPFIHYAKSHLSAEETIKEKRRLRKCLLVFPAHSSFQIGIEYNIHTLCKKIKKMGKDFDTIRVCLYWADILLGRHKIYQEYQFQCVTAGHMLDPNFLPRLKSIIETSDLTVSNIPGTHVGYSVYLGKPHIIFYEKPRLKTNKKWGRYMKEFFEAKPYNEVLKEFSQSHLEITPRQRKLVDTYWGTSHIKTQKELKNIVDKTEQIYKEHQKI